jgi:prephenate dehydrogenase
VTARQTALTVAVIGVGMVGGSVAAALKAGGRCAEVIGFSPEPDGSRALELGLIDRLARSVADAVAGADRIVLAAPIPAMPQVLRELRPVLRPDALITDCASAKSSVIAAADRELGDAFDRFLPGHPIAGSERNGPDAARAELFRDRRWLFCPARPVQTQWCESWREVLQVTGARFSEIDPALHDRVFAEVSHWPHAVAFVMGAAIARGELAEEAIRYAGAGLRDTSRIAASPADLWSGILLDNAGPVLESAERFRAELDRLIDALARRDRGALTDILDTASRWRRRID